MNSSLEHLCMKKIQSLDHKNLHKLLPQNLYISYVDYLIGSNIDCWKNKMNMVNLEINIEDMDVNYDMYLDTPTYHIFVKKKFEDLEYDGDWESKEEEYELFHEFDDESGLYDLYYNIALKRDMID
jgi:hypothetical protein